AAVTLLVISSAYALLGLLNRKDEAKTRVSKRLIFAVLPALTVFLAGLYLRVFPVSYEALPAVGPNVVWVTDTVRQSYGELSFFVNYLGMNTGMDIYPNYLFLVPQVFMLFALLYLPYFYLVWKGFFRDEILGIWTGLLLIGSLGCLITPFFALDLWHRWMFMLVYPFTFYAVNGAKILFNRLRQGKVPLGNLRKKMFGIVFATVLLGTVFLATPFLMVNVGFGIYSLPASIYFCTSPTVPYQDVNGTIQAVHWLKDNMQNDSCAVLQNCFVTWAELYLENSHNIIGYMNDVDLAVDSALQEGYKHIYFVCWNENVGWYCVDVPERFVELQSFSRISIYEYVW
ncbi:hypothetical protein KAU92_05500, partial [Candidatus Bathyarchaeota archaeon]|nr:hypothetical protein [Candidatus Bathyarchaeota archaeon]